MIIATPSWVQAVPRRLCDGTVRREPVLSLSQLVSRKRTSEQLPRGNDEQHLIGAVNGMDVRRPVILRVDVEKDAKRFADSRHMLEI